MAKKLASDATLFAVTVALIGLGLVTVALTVALGQWLGWMAGVVQTGSLARL